MATFGHGVGTLLGPRMRTARARSSPITTTTTTTTLSCAARRRHLLIWISTRSRLIVAHDDDDDDKEKSKFIYAGPGQREELQAQMMERNEKQKIAASNSEPTSQISTSLKMPDFKLLLRHMRATTREMSKMSPKCTSLQLTFVVISTLLLLLLLPAARGQQQFSADQASNAISMLLKPNQQSACDGEQLDIRCNDDYVIEIITAELTVLAKELHSAADANSSDLICAPLATTTTTTIEAQSVSCSDERAHELSAANQAKFLTLVRKQCSLLNSCTLDFRLATVSTQQTNQTDNTTTNSQAANFRDFARFLQDRCPRNRKLLELAYKCRPSRVKSRAACRDGRLVLECPTNSTATTIKRLAIGSAVYGFWPDEKKTHERCLAEEERRTGSGPAKVNGEQLLRNCSTISTHPLAAVAGECLFKQQCQLTVKPQLMRPSPNDSTCPTTSGLANQQQQHLEYLKVIYVCLNEDLLITTNSSLIMQRQFGGSRASSASEMPSTSSQVSSPSSSLLSPATANISAPTPTSQQLAQETGSGGSSGGVSEKPVTMTILENSTHDKGGKRAPHNYPHPDPSVRDDTQDLIEQDEVTPSRVYAVVAADPALNSVPPSQWTTAQRVKFLLLRYQPQLVGVAVIFCFTMFLIAGFLARACRHSSSSSRNGSTTSSSSSKSSNFTSSSKSSSSAYNNSSTVASQQQLMSAVNQQHHKYQHAHPLGTTTATRQQQQQQQQTNSCSESCFSLDEYAAAAAAAAANNNMHHQRQLGIVPPPLHLNTNTTRTNSSSSPAANNSPALQSHHTTPPMSAGLDQQQEWHQQRALDASNGGVRPKFWSFYGNEQHSNSLRLGNFASLAHQQHQPQTNPMVNATTAATLQRPQRSFMGQQQQQQQQQLQQQRHAAPTLGRNFQCLQHHLNQHQNDYLLAMAAVNQAANGLVVPPTPPGEEHWHNDGQAENQHHFLTLNPADLNQQQQQQTCAFHQHQLAAVPPPPPQLFFAPSTQEQHHQQADGLQAPDHQQH